MATLTLMIGSLQIHDTASQWRKIVCLTQYESSKSSIPVVSTQA